MNLLKSEVVGEVLRSALLAALEEVSSKRFCDSVPVVSKEF